MMISWFGYLVVVQTKQNERLLVDSFFSEKKRMWRMARG